MMRIKVLSFFSLIYLAMRIENFIFVIVNIEKWKDMNVERVGKARDVIINNMARSIFN